METSSEPRTYELAYHLNPELEEADVKVRAQELSDLVTQAGGSVITSMAPRNTHLSYQIEHKQYAHFGILDFSAPAETLEKINARMKLQGGILRYLLLKKPENKELRILGQHRTRPRIKTHEAVAPEAIKKPPKEKTEAEKQQLEQEVEKVIEGL